MPLKCEEVDKVDHCVHGKYYSQQQPQACFMQPFRHLSPNGMYVNTYLPPTHSYSLENTSSSSGSGKMVWEKLHIRDQGSRICQCLVTETCALMPDQGKYQIIATHSTHSARITRSLRKFCPSAAWMSARHKGIDRTISHDDRTRAQVKFDGICSASRCRL